MRKSDTSPAPLDNKTTMPALLTQPGVFPDEDRSAGVKPIYRWIFITAVLALLAVVIVLR